MALMDIWAAVLITYGVSTGPAMISAASKLNDVLPLDMAPDSVDDMYSGCEEIMKTKVNEEYLPNEKNKSADFKRAWDDAETHDKQWPFNGLEKDQAFAIYVYTLSEPKIYLDFNKKVRTQAKEYKTNFNYHALHFLLTTAIQILKKKERRKIFRTRRCLTAFRRVNGTFSKDKKIVKKEIRFGSFTSSSEKKYPDPKIFGNKSCFKIYTCYGARISRFSKIEIEKEVLIPPYEVFKITEIKEKSPHNDLPCEVVYKLKSTRKLSKLNCSLFTK